MNLICQVIADNKIAYSGQNICKLIATVRENLSELIQRRLTELNIKKSELARRTGFSRTYITDIANGTGNTQSGQYNLPPETVGKLAKALEISETEILGAMNYLPENGVGARKPKSVAEFIKRLNEMGFEIQFDADLTRLTPDDLQDLIDSIEANLLVKTRKL